MWVYYSTKKSSYLIRLFDCKAERDGTFLQRFLESYHGYIHTDADKGYEKSSGITRCFGRTHLRRYFAAVLPKDIENQESTIPAQAVSYSNKWFKTENKLEILFPLQEKAGCFLEILKEQKPVQVSIHGLKQ